MAVVVQRLRHVRPAAHERRRAQNSVFCFVSASVGWGCQISYLEIMKFTFSIRRLLVVTTVIAILLGIAEWLGLFGASSFFLTAIGIYSFGYLTIFCVFFLPRYLRQWTEFRQRGALIREEREKLEKEVQRKLLDRGKDDLFND